MGQERALHAEEALQLAIKLLVHTFHHPVITHPKPRVAIEENDVFLIIGQVISRSRRSVIQPCVLKSIIGFSVCNIVATRIQGGNTDPLPVTMGNFVEVVSVDRIVVHQVQAAHCKDGVHIGGRRLRSKVQCACIGHIKRVVHFQHSIVAVGHSCDVRQTTQIDVGIVDDEVVAALDGRQGTGSRCHLVTQISRVHITYTIVPQRDVTAQCTRFAVGTASV